MYTAPKGGRLFTLCPLLSLQMRYIDIDKQTLGSLIRKTGNNKRISQDIDELFWEAFDFTRIGVKSRDAMNTEKRRFWKVVRSDGTAIDFLFGRPKRDSNGVEKNITDIGLGLTKDRLWGVDPGITDVFVAVDGNDEGAENIDQRILPHIRMEQGAESGRVMAKQCQP